MMEWPEESRQISSMSGDTTCYKQRSEHCEQRCLQGGRVDEVPSMAGVLS